MTPDMYTPGDSNQPDYTVPNPSRLQSALSPPRCAAMVRYTAARKCSFMPHAKTAYLPLLDINKAGKARKGVLRGGGVERKSTVHPASVLGVITMYLYFAHPPALFAGSRSAGVRRAGGTIGDDRGELMGGLASLPPPKDFVFSFCSFPGAVGGCDGDMYTMMFSAFSLSGSGVDEPECCCEKKVTAVAGPVHPCPPDDPWRWDSLAEATRCPIGDRPEPTPASDGATRAGIPSPHPPPTPSAPTQKADFLFPFSPPPRRRSASVRAAAVGWLHSLSCPSRKRPFSTISDLITSSTQYAGR